MLEEDEDISKYLTSEEAKWDGEHVFLQRIVFDNPSQQSKRKLHNLESSQTSYRLYIAADWMTSFTSFTEKKDPIYITQKIQIE